MQKISDNVYAETKFRGCNCGFVVTSEGVVVIDTPMLPIDATKWRDEIAKHGTIRYLINTEPHLDHFSGNYFFDCPVIAHEGAREAILSTSVDDLKERLKQMSPESLPLMEGFSYRPPSITLSERLTIHLGNHTFKLINFPGHTPFQIAVYIPEERVLFTSDNIFYKTQALLHDALPYEWLNSLEQIGKIEADVLVPGHGDICDRTYIPEMKAFIQSWMDAVTTAIKQELSLEEAQDKISLLDRYPVEPGMEFMAHEIQRMNVARLYAVLQK